MGKRQAISNDETEDRRRYLEGLSLELEIVKVEKEIRFLRSLPNRWIYPHLSKLNELGYGPSFWLKLAWVIVVILVSPQALGFSFLIERALEWTKWKGP